MEIIESLDIAYGNSDFHRFDAYFAQSAQNDVLICFVHGGAWVSEDKSNHSVLARKIATKTKGVVLVPNYRLTPRRPSPETCLQHPSHCEDILLFLNHLLSWDGPLSSPTPRSSPLIYLIGHSCSAHMLASIFMDSTSITPSLTPPPSLIGSIQAIVVSEGIYDIDLLVSSFPDYLDAFITPVFGRRMSYMEFSTMRFALRDGGHHIRWLVIHSKGDKLVDMQQSHKMYEHLVLLYQDAKLSADEHVKKCMDVLDQQHDDIFVDDYVRIISDSGPAPLPDKLP